MVGLCELRRVGGVITRDLCTYSIIILRQDKSLRDHGRGAVRRRYSSVQGRDELVQWVRVSRSASVLTWRGGVMKLAYGFSRSTTRSSLTAILVACSRAEASSSRPAISSSTPTSTSTTASRSS